MLPLIQLALAIILFSATCIHGRRSLHSHAQTINLWKLSRQLAPTQNIELEAAAPTFPQFNFTQPLDHFQDTGFTFVQRYWVSDRYYKPGGPVIVLDSGEDSGTDRLPYMQQGIVDILTNATHGLGIILEHRYYGKSVPVLNFTTDSLRCVDEPIAPSKFVLIMINYKLAEQ